MNIILYFHERLGIGLQNLTQSFIDPGLLTAISCLALGIIKTPPFTGCCTYTHYTM